MGRPKKTSGATQGFTAKRIHSLEGSLDIVSDADALWEVLLKRLAKTARVYGFARIETPLVEDFHLYENYFHGNQALLASLVPVEAGSKPGCLRPFLLPSVLRSYYQHKVFEQHPLNKWAYSGLTVKQDQLSKKLVHDYEFGFEILGSFSHLTEAQIIGSVWEFLLSLGLKDLSIEINNIGNEECQAAYQDTLHDYLSGKKYELCDTCNEHLQGRA